LPLLASIKVEAPGAYRNCASVPFLGKEAIMHKKELDKDGIGIYNCIYINTGVILIKEIRWSKLKSIHLKLIRGVSFEEIVKAKFIDVHDHPKRNNQKILAYEYKGYIWAVPFVLENDIAFLKTLYASRKYKRLYQRGKI